MLLLLLRMRTLHSRAAHLECCCCCGDRVFVAEDVPQPIRAQDDKAVLVGLQGQARHVWLALHEAGWLLEVQVTQGPAGTHAKGRHTPLASAGKQDVVVPPLRCLPYPKCTELWCQ